MIEKNRIRSFVRRAGRLSPLQQRALDNYGNMLLPYTEGDRVDPREIFLDKSRRIMEIGFGMGDATWQIAQEHRETGYLGIEVHTPGVGKLLHEAGTRNLDNIRVISYDAVPVIQGMPENSLEGIHIFFPDPWPKKKHHKRRLIQTDFLHLLATRLVPGGYIYFVTDWEDYAHWAMDYFEKEPLLSNTYEGFAEGQTWRPRTKFEAKGLDKQHQIFEIHFTKQH